MLKYSKKSSLIDSGVLKIGE